MADLKQTFILKALADYNQSVIDTMRAVMRKRKVGITDEGYQSLAYKVFAAGNGAYSNLSFKEYLRFVDMGVGRGHPLGGLKGVSIALQASKQTGLSLVKDNGRKPKPIYSKVAYGKISYLQGKLLYGYTEETIAMLKQELEKQNPA
jgi:hypothetical protein